MQILPPPSVTIKKQTPNTKHKNTNIFYPKLKSPLAIDWRFLSFLDLAVPVPVPVPVPDEGTVVAAAVAAAEAAPEAAVPVLVPRTILITVPRLGGLGGEGSPAERADCELLGVVLPLPP